MNNPAENEICPYCGAPAVDITRMEDSERRWLCTGGCGREWFDGEAFEDPEELVQRPSLFKRFRQRFNL